jgi:AraC family transcriptional regulator
LRGRDTQLFADRDQLVDGAVEPLLVMDGRLVPPLEAPGPFRRVSAAAVLAGEQPSGERAPDQHPEPLVEGDRDQLRLSVARLERVVDLLADELLEPPPVGDPQRLHQLPPREVRRADVAHLAGGDQGVEGGQRLIERRLPVPLVHLVQIDVVGSEPPQARFGGAEDVVPREAGVVGSVAHRHPHLRGEQDLIAVRTEGLADDLLAQPVRIHIGRVDEVDSRVAGHVDLPSGAVDAELPHGARPARAAVPHGAQRDRRNPQTRAPQLPVLHGHKCTGPRREDLGAGSPQRPRGIRKKCREGDSAGLYLGDVFQPVGAATISRYEESVLPVLIHCEDHLEDPLQLDDLAAMAGFSPHHFHRIFQHVTGEAPKEYLRRLRLERAVHRLKVSPDNVLEIALQAGFKSNETFSRAFTREFGIHPSEFRRVLRAYREAAYDAMGSATFAGFTDETPLTLRFNMGKEPVTVKATPGMHLVFVRHSGYESLLEAEQPFLALWDELIAYADAQHIQYSPDLLVGITHDDPYVTDDRRIRFDAGLLVRGPMNVSSPFGYRFVPPGLCVVRRHAGGMEEIAKTFAYIGVDWLLPCDYSLRASAPFEIHTCTRAADGTRERLHTDAYVPLEPTQRRQSGES